MAGQQKQPTRNRKIEPLNWAEAANSPALKGMMSFLDIKPEEVRSGHFKDVPSDSDSHNAPVGDTLTGGESLKVTTGTKASPANAVIEMRPKRSPSATSLPQAQEVVPEIAPEFGSDSTPNSDVLPVSVSPTGGETLPVGESPSSTRVILGSVPSQNRKIRKCRLSQDAHSAGEESLYRILWEEGRPESANPLGSRVVRIGYAELANKARMHKANVRLNLANLTAKLAIEQSGDFSSRDMIAKSYRVLSYKEILERRRAAGLEYVIRQKNVVFVTALGEPIPLPGLAQKGKRRMGGNPSDTNGHHPVSDSRPVRESPPVGDSLPVSEPLSVGDSLPVGESPEFQADFAFVSKAMNAYWTVDDAATEQLIRACRKVRPDAQAEEIAFFVSEKLELARSNRAINNPVGLILATVPQSFSGYSFETFRQRRQERKRLAEEESNRKAEEDRMLREWILRDAKKTLASPNSTEKSRREAEDLLATYSEAQADIE
jgi:hypothetical protein